jgi:hypothetical protein
MKFKGMDEKSSKEMCEFFREGYEHQIITLRPIAMRCGYWDEECEIEFQEMLKERAERKGESYQQINGEFSRETK